MVNIPLGKNAPFRKIYFGAIIPINNAVTQSDKKVYIRVCLFSCHCCKLLFANKKSNAPSTKPLASEGIERFSTKPATPLPATIIAHGYVTQKSYITFLFPSSRLLLSSSSLTENTKSLVLAFGVHVLVVFLFWGLWEGLTNLSNIKHNTQKHLIFGVTKNRCRTIAPPMEHPRHR